MLMTLNTRCRLFPAGFVDVVHTSVCQCLNTSRQRANPGGDPFHGVLSLPLQALPRIHRIWDLWRKIGPKGRGADGLDDEIPSVHSLGQSVLALIQPLGS